MKGLVKYDRGVSSVEIREVPEPKVIPGHVIIEVAACGICGTDLHILADEYPYKPPVVLGHEFSGTIAEVGPEVSRFRPGDRVVSIPFFRTSEFRGSGPRAAVETRDDVSHRTDDQCGRF